MFVVSVLTCSQSLFCRGAAYGNRPIEVVIQLAPGTKISAKFLIDEQSAALEVRKGVQELSADADRQCAGDIRELNQG